nr:piggyBac transposable element-derived protein 3-like [Onthophagus taurus]
MSGDIPNDITGHIEVMCEFDDDNEHCPQEPMCENNEDSDISDRPFVLLKPKWMKTKNYKFLKQPVVLSIEKHADIYTKLGALNPLQLFELFIDADVINFIVQSTNRYAAIDRNDPSFKTDVEEVRKVIGILFVTGYHTLPIIRCYWSDSPSLGCAIIKASMTRDRFLRVKAHLHVCDNRSLDPKDKFAKVIPLNDMMNERFMQFGVFAHNLSIDEQMIAYFGRHSC